MISISIPGKEPLLLNYLVLDYNGTIAEDGEIIPECIPLLEQLAQQVTIYVLTADTHGTVQQKLKDLPCSLHIIGNGEQDRLKLNFIEELGADSTVTFGNGRNDMLMLKKAALGVGLLQKEGASFMALTSSDLVCTNIVDGLELLTKPNRLIATLRN